MPSRKAAAAGSLTATSTSRVRVCLPAKCQPVLLPLVRHSSVSACQPLNRFCLLRLSLRLALHLYAALLPLPIRLAPDLRLAGRRRDRSLRPAHAGLAQRLAAHRELRRAALAAHHRPAPLRQPGQRRVTGLGRIVALCYHSSASHQIIPLFLRRECDPILGAYREGDLKLVIGGMGPACYDTNYPLEPSKHCRPGKPDPHP